MYKNLNSKSFFSRCKCVSCFDTILVVNPEEWFSHDAAQNSWFLVFGWAFRFLKCRKMLVQSYNVTELVFPNFFVMCIYIKVKYI